MTENIGFIGAGSWGTALANLMATNGHVARVWDLDSEVLDMIETHRENRKYLPEVMLSDSLKVVRTCEEAVSDAKVVVFAVPAQHFSNAVGNAAQYMPESAIILNVAKGIEQKSLLTISQIARTAAAGHRYVVLSGPSHAEEVGRFLPTTVAVASENMEAAEFIQDLMTTDRFRLYTNNDVLGLELGGALKNIIALGAGISDGMGFGDNTKAALMTRGMAEMIRLGVALGAKAETFSGLSGIGDLIVTCTSMHSRNRRCGIMIGEGIAPDEAVKRVGMVVEGIYTAEAAVGLARKHGIEMPITESVYKVVKGEIKPEEALLSLMTRPRKHEHEL